VKRARRRVGEAKAGGAIRRLFLSPSQGFCYLKQQNCCRIVSLSKLYAEWMLNFRVTTELSETSLCPEE
jgi:hypothetical protein